MSSLAHLEGIIGGDPLDEIWSLYQEILSEHPTIHQPLIMKENSLHEATKIIGSEAVEAQQHLAITEEGTFVENIGLKNSSTRNINKRKRNWRTIDKNNIENSNGGICEEGPSSSVLDAKKLDHNAKERIRRMKVNASFIALRELMPDHSRRSKKRLKAPAIVDRALKYIPELENEIEVLVTKKEKMKSDLKKNKKVNIGNGVNLQHQSCSVSINEVNEHDAIVQICMGREEELHQQGSTFANLLLRVEDEGHYIISASSVFVCETRTCYNLHIQMNQISYGADYIAELQEKFLSWLR